VPSSVQKTPASLAQSLAMSSSDVLDTTASPLSHTTPHRTPRAATTPMLSLRSGGFSRARSSGVMATPPRSMLSGSTLGGGGNTSRGDFTLSSPGGWRTPGGAATNNTLPDSYSLTRTPGRSRLGGGLSSGLGSSQIARGRLLTSWLPEDRPGPKLSSVSNDLTNATGPMLSPSAGMNGAVQAADVSRTSSHGASASFVEPQQTNGAVVEHESVELPIMRRFVEGGEWESRPTLEDMQAYGKRLTRLPRFEIRRRGNGDDYGSVTFIDVDLTNDGLTGGPLDVDAVVGMSPSEMELTLYPTGTMPPPGRGLHVRAEVSFHVAALRMKTGARLAAKTASLQAALQASFSEWRVEDVLVDTHEGVLSYVLEVPALRVNGG